MWGSEDRRRAVGNPINPSGLNHASGLKVASLARPRASLPRAAVLGLSIRAAGALCFGSRPGEAGKTRPSSHFRSWVRDVIDVQSRHFRLGVSGDVKRVQTRLSKGSSHL